MLTYKNCTDTFSRNVRNNRHKLGNNTYLYRNVDGSFAVRLHNTDIVTIHADDTYTLNSGGWRTVTTKARMNEFSPAHLTQERGVWYLRQGSNWDNWKDTRIVFSDGMRLDAKGMALDYSQEDSKRVERKDKEINKVISAYIRGAGEYFVDYVREHNDMPSSAGDCLYCQMREVGTDKTLGELHSHSDHLALHIHERYYQTSMLMNACKHWNGGAVAQFVFVNLKVGRADVLRQVLRKYLRANLASIRNNWESTKEQIAAENSD